MAEEQRIVFQLIDQAGTSTGTASAPSPQSGSIPPGSQVAQEFQQQVTAGGADRVVGRGSAPASAYATSQTPSVAVSGDPLLAATRQIFSADPRTTANELQQALGIESSRAQSLIDSLYSTSQTPSPLASPSPSRQPSTTNSVDDLIRGMPQYPQTSTDNLIQGVRESMASEAEDRANVTRQREAESRRRIEELGPIEPYSPFGSSYDPFHMENRSVGEGDLEAAGRMVQNARSLNTQTNTQGEEAPDMSGANTLLHTGAGLANQFPGGRVASTAINALGAFANTEAGTAALSGVLPSLAVAGPYVAAAAAAIAVPAAAVYAGLNEAERARGLVGNFSPEAAMANAEAGVRQLMANLRTASRLGDEASEYTTARSRLSAAAQDVRDKLSEPLLNEVNAGLRLVADAMETLSSALGENTAASIAGTLGLNPLQKLEDMATYLKIIKSKAEADEERKRKEGIGTPFGWFAAQPHLGNPLNMGVPIRGSVAPVAGLSF